MIQIKHRNNLQHRNIAIHTIALSFLLAAPLTATTVSAESCPDNAKELSIWEHTKQLSIAGWQSTKQLSSDAWDDSLAFFEKDDNSSWSYITAGGAGMAVSGASAITTTSILGLVTVVSTPAWAPVAICAGGAIAAVGATQLILENIDDQ